MRTKRLLALLALALCLVVGTACTVTVGGEAQDGAASDAPVDTAMDGGQQAAQDTSPLEGIDASARVVALSRSVGEMWLLAGGQLVGVTDDALDLAGLAEDAVSIGSVSKPSLEQVVALEPDLVMLTEDLPAHKQLHESLDEAAIPVLVVDVNSFDDYDALMQQLTAATGCDDLYERNVTNVRAQIDRVVANTTAPAENTYLALRTSATKNKVLKHDYFACAMLDDLGLTNVADDSSALDDLSLEAIAAADPDWVFVIYQGDAAEAQQAFEEAFASNPVWGSLRATQNAHVVVLPKLLFQYKPNAKWGEAYAYLSQLLHGSLA